MSVPHRQSTRGVASLFGLRAVRLLMGCIPATRSRNGGGHCEKGRATPKGRPTSKALFLAECYSVAAYDRTDGFLCTIRRDLNYRSVLGSHYQVRAKEGDVHVVQAGVRK